ncbi:MAG: glycoside hydrolase family 3 C-terminal domain-containing protein [bacterium]
MGQMTDSDLIAAMTVAEKIAFLNGHGLWRSAAVDRLGIPSLIMTDGAYGVRYSTTQIDAGADAAESLQQFLTVANARADDPGMFGTTRPATCFPNANLSACSWDVELAYQMGAALGTECRAFGVHLLLGPGINIRRTPLAGRAFEYYSEDPVISGDMAAALINGLQAQGVGASLKHFACNNSEIDRTNVSSDVSERALREVYLAGFERAIAKSEPWTVMSAYNPLNGLQAAEHPWLLTQVLRQDWGYDGLVVSDWHAIKNRPASLLAGTDLDMPDSPGRRAALQAAVEAGQIAEPVLERACLRMLRLVRRAVAGATRPAPPMDPDQHHRIARQIATDSIVLLKNDGAILPLPKSDLRLLVVGQGAVEPTIQGSGSASTRPTRVDVPLDEIRKLLGQGADLVHLPWPPDAKAEAALFLTAKTADVVLIFASHRPGRDGEGADRDSLALDHGQDGLISALSKSHRVIVTLTSPDAVDLPWAAEVPAILACFFPGQGGGAALAAILFGDANPCGKLTTTFPQRIGEIPGYLSYPGENLHHFYSEGVFVGYRGYDLRGTEPAFPFGHGLSYTAFRYDTLTLSAGTISPKGEITARVTVTNTGNRSGKEVVQIYLRPVAPALRRPLRELKAFAKVSLHPHESATLTFHLTARDFCHYDPADGRFVLRGAGFVVEAAASSRDIRLSAPLICESEPPRPVARLTTTSANKLLADPKVAAAVQELLQRSLALSAAESLALIDNCRGSFLGLHDTLSWYIGASLSQADLQDRLDRLV